jgi:protease secretion system membrane fusion protein
MANEKSTHQMLPGASPAEAPAPEDHATDTKRATRVGLWALGIGFGGFLLWAGLAPLDEGVPTMATVSIDTKRKAVQHQTGGIIKEMLVREGQLVKEGQVLARLDEASARANYEGVRQRYLSLRAMQGRLLAEQSGQAGYVMHPDLKASASDPLIASQIATQQQLLASRRSALRAELQGIEEAIQGQEVMLQTYETMLPSRRSQLALLNEELASTRGLVQEGFAPRNRQLELERMVADSSLANAELVGNISRTRRAIAEQRQRVVQRQQEYRKEVESQLGDITREVQSDVEKLVAVKADLERVEIKSPATGQVVGLAVQTVGGVLQQGQKLMDIVPAEGQDLLLEARIPPNLIDKVTTGLPVDIRFSAFAHSPQLVVDGRVGSVSGDLLTDTANPQITYYLARVAVTPEGMKTLGKREMHPGMPAEVVIKTGGRTVLTYLLHPLTKRMAASMKEE